MLRNSISCVRIRLTFKANIRSCHARGADIECEEALNLEHSCFRKERNSDTRNISCFARFTWRDRGFKSESRWVSAISTTTMTMTTMTSTATMTMTMTTSTTCPTSCPGSCRAEWYANTLYGSGRYGWLVHAATNRVRLPMMTT